MLGDVVSLLSFVVVFVNDVKCCLNFCRCCVFVVAVVIEAYFADVVVVVVVVIVAIDG